MGNNIQEHIESIAETKVAALNNAITKLVIDYDRRIDALESALAELGNTDISALELRVSTLEDKCENCESTIAELSSSISPLIEQIGVMQSNISDLQATVISLQSQIDIIRESGGNPPS